MLLSFAVVIILFFMCALFANRKSNYEEKVFTLKRIGRHSATTTKTLVAKCKEIQQSLILDFTS